MTPRHRAREAALQILYFAGVGGVPPDQALDTFFAEHAPDAPAAVRAFAAEIVQGVSAGAAELDERIAAASHRWRLERLAILDRLVLQMAVWELQHERDTPPAVILNEAIELARAFGGDDSARFVNGVLDGIRKTLTV